MILTAILAAVACGGRVNVTELSQGIEPEVDPSECDAESLVPLDGSVFPREAGAPADASGGGSCPEPLPILYADDAASTKVTFVNAGDSVARGFGVGTNQLPYGALAAQTAGRDVTFMSVAKDGESLAQMDTEFAAAVRPLVVGRPCVVSTNGGINDLKGGDGGAGVAATIAHASSYCAQVRDAGCTSILVQMTPVDPSAIPQAVQDDYADAEAHLVATHGCDYLVPRDESITRVDLYHPDGWSHVKIWKRFDPVLHSALQDAGVVP